MRSFEAESIAQPPAPLPAHRANRPEGRAYAPEGEQREKGLRMEDGGWRRTGS